jgi:TPP-dependent pyruvate/acetoin dehydrogenase alpha subunit
MKKWEDLLSKFSSPIERLEKYMKINGLYDEDRTKTLRKNAKMAVRDSLKAASLL